MPGTTSLTMCWSISRVPTETAVETIANKSRLASFFLLLWEVQAPLPIKAGEKCVAAFEDVEEFGTT